MSGIMERRILVLSASVGAGHLRAAQAVELALKELSPQSVIQNIDVLDFTNATFRRIYAQSYLDLVNPIPGQESRNSDFLLENGAAIKINNLGTLGYKLSQLLGSPDRIALLQQNARRLGRPDAAFVIARAAIDWPA